MGAVAAMVATVEAAAEACKGGEEQTMASLVAEANLAFAERYQCNAPKKWRGIFI